MPIQTNYTIEDRLKEDPLFKEYLIQSVANLGQRLAVKGDSVITRSFAFKDLFDISEYISNETHVGVVERRNGQIYISIRDLETLADTPAQEMQVLNTNNSIALSTEIELTTPINGVTNYASGGTITVFNTKNILTFIGKNESGDYSEFLCDEFNRITNEFISGLRICRLSDRTTAVFIKRYPNYFDVTIYDIENKLENLLENMHLRMLDLNEKNVNIANFNPEYWLNYEIKTVGTPFNVQIEAGSMELSTVLKLDINDPFHYAVLEKYPGINTVLGYFIYDNRVFYPFIKQYYSESVYTANDLGFKQQIITAIFNTVYNNVVRNNKMYIPVDYIFEYYCNSNDIWQIYGSVSDITIRYVNTPINIYNVHKYYNGSSFVANIVGDNQMAIFDYSVEYDNDENAVVSNIYVNKKYTLPYINSNDVWVVDGLTTDVLAKGRDAGNPNIIIVYNENKNLLYPQILCGANKESVLNKLSWEEKSVYIQPLEQINLNDPKTITEPDFYKLSCTVPKVSQYSSEQDIEQFVTPLEYALIVNMSSVNCLDVIDDNVIERYGRYGIITTLWMMNEKTKEFEVVENPAFADDFRNVALDINSLTNLNNVIKWHIKNAELKRPDKYRYKWLVFENALTSTKQVSKDYQSYIYPVMLNQPAVEEEFNEYNNDFNFIIKYMDLVRDAEADDITSIDTTNALRFLDSAQRPVTASLYSYYDNYKRSLYNEYIPSTDIPTFNLKEILVQNQTLENRTNIISFNREGYMYYSYFGTSFDDPDKNRTRIGSATKNINIGSETMMMPNDELFRKSTELHLDFPNNFINGDAKFLHDIDVKHDVNVDHLVWTNKIVNNQKVYYTNYIPISKMFLSEFTSTSGNIYEQDPSKYYVCAPLQFNNNIITSGPFGKHEIIYNQILEYYAEANEKKPENKLWVPSVYCFNQEFVKPFKYVYMGECLFLPNLLRLLELEDYATSDGLTNVVLTSNCKIITFNNNVPLFLITHNRFIKNIEYIDYGGGSIAFPVDQDKIYSGNSLDISYYINSGKLYLTINEAIAKPIVNNLFPLKINY